MPSHYEDEEYGPIKVRDIERMNEQLGPPVTSQAIANVKPPPPKEEKPWWHGVAAGTGVEIGTGYATDLATTPLLAAGPIGWAGYGLINFGSGVVSNYAAQKLRGEEKISVGELLTSGAVDLIPYLGQKLKGAKGVANIALQSGARGLAQRQGEVAIDKGRLLTPEEAITSAGVGAVFGGTFKGATEGVSRINTKELKNKLLAQINPGGTVLSTSGQGLDAPRPARRRSLYGETFERAKTYKSELQLQQLEEELVLNWGMTDRTFHFDQYKARSANRAKGSADKRKLGAMFESVPYTKANYEVMAKARMPELRKYYAPILEDIGLNPGDFQLHHQQPILASLPGYDGLRFGSDEWWDVTEILWKKGLRAGDHDKNLIPLVGGSKASKKNVKNKKALDITGRFETPHSVTHKYLDEKVGPDGTLFWTEDVLDRINGRGKWEGKGVDHQFRLDKWEEYADIVLKSKQITDQAQQTFKDLYKRNPALKDVPVDPKEIDLVIERLVKLEEDGLVKPEILEGRWQVNQMESIVMDVTEELQKSQADFNYRAIFGTRPDEMEKFVGIREIAEDELRELDKLPLSEQLEALQRYTGMTIEDINLIIQTQPKFDPIKFIRENR